MENASKALIIAGAIIISIVLISLGVFVLNGATDLVKSSSDMSSQEVQAFNSKFISYEGTKINGANAKSLCTVIRTHNAQYSDDPAKQVSITFEQGKVAEDGKPAETAVTLDQTSINALRPGNTYTITFGYDTTFNSGRIITCNISKNQ
ncbi:MAG: hypothetical protein J6M60_05545 [Clostridia bacterium]|nr:hypothetical protein [Clostridia bacterium]